MTHLIEKKYDTIPLPGETTADGLHWRFICGIDNGTQKIQCKREKPISGLNNLVYRLLMENNHDR